MHMIVLSISTQKALHIVTHNSCVKPTDTLNAGQKRVYMLVHQYIGLADVDYFNSKKESLSTNIMRVCHTKE